MPQSGHAQLLLRIQDHQGLLFSLREGWNAKVHKMKEFLCWEEVNRYLRPSFIHSFTYQAILMPGTGEKATKKVGR